MADIDDTSTTAPVEGIHAEEVTAWFAEHVPEARPPLGFDLIAGGRSNLTYSVTDSTGARWVLRRPPLGHVLATAHDMGREHRIIAALAATAVPVPPVIGLSPDDAVNGAPFYVMAFVDGPILRNREAALTLPIEARARATDSMVDVLAAIHAVDVDAVGLGELGRRDGYIERQLKRWQGQWEKTKTRELPVIDAVHDRLAASVPEQGPATIVHGDYRLDNCILDSDGRIRAVLDWELCTLGDPLADVGQLCMYWTEPGDTLVAAPDAPTTAEGFGTRADLLARYGEVSGRDLSEIDYYMAFGFWKLACICEGVLKRYQAGVMGGADVSGLVEMFTHHVANLAAAAATTLDMDP
jgi:aminoglycoside phosphotransferase (APT) family kinase protein